MRELLAFASVAAVIVVLPGPDMALVLRNGVAAGRRAALETALGITSGLLVWALAAAVGVAATLNASATAFTALRVAGGVYLAWLGLRALRHAWRGTQTLVTNQRSRSGRRASSAFRQGLLSNLLNPKIALVFTTLIPQFVGGDAGALRPLLLAAIFIAMGLAWLTTYALLVSQVANVLRRPAVQRIVNAVVGAILTAFGVRLTLDRSQG